MKEIGSGMQKIFIVTMLLSGCSYLPSKDKRVTKELQTTMDREKGIYRFCSTAGGDGKRCPTPTVKTPEGSISEGKRVDIEQVTKIDNSMNNVVDLAIKMSNTSSKTKPLLHLNFKFRSAEMYPESFEQLKMSVSQLSAKKIILKGYTDNIGLLSKNESLALERSKEVKRLLQEYGLKNEEILTEGYPLCCYLEDNSTDENRKENRRVEIYTVTDDLFSEQVGR